MTNDDISSDVTAKPLTVTVDRACELIGLGRTSIWAMLGNGTLERVRIPGIRRTLISYRSVSRLLPPSSPLQPAPRDLGRPAQMGRVISADGSYVPTKATKDVVKAQEISGPHRRISVDRAE
jgi:hypothetical protein